MKKRLLALSLTLLMALSIMPTYAFAEENGQTDESGVNPENTEADLPEVQDEDPGLMKTPNMLKDAGPSNTITFIPVSPDNEYDVRINGAGDVVTIYCLQQIERWPYGSENVPYVNHDDANHDEYEYYNLLSDEEIQIMRRLVWAGYPNDSQGYLRRLGEELGGMDAEFAGFVTNSAIWALMTEWGKAGSDPNQIVDYNNPDDDPVLEAVIDMILFAKGNSSIEAPASSTILIDGSGKLSSTQDGKWSTGDLAITHPTGYDLIFDLNLPDGASAVDENGNTITSIEENQTFRIVTSDPDAVADKKFSATAVAKYPTEVSFFVTNMETGNKDQAGRPQTYQTMLYIEEASRDLHGELTLTSAPEGSLSVSKTVVGDGADLSKPFNFTVTLSDNTVNGTYGEMVFTDGTANFALKNGESALAQDLPANINYTVTETPVDEYESAGVNERGTIADGTTTEVSFTNTYKTDVEAVDVQFSGVKKLEGKTLAADEFSFTLTGEDDGVNETVKNGADGKIQFSKITFEEEGVFKYTVKENSTREHGVTIDDKTYNITVTVTNDGSGRLEAAISGDTTTGTDLIFTNKYEATGTEVQFSGSKTLEGKKLEANEFSFTLTGENDGVKETVKNGADGKIQFGKISYSKAGVYKYTVKEESTKEAGITIDSKIYHITVTVTDNGNGYLEAAISGDTKTGNDLKFVNKYSSGKKSSDKKSDDKGVKTGDNSNVITWLILLLGSAFIIIVAVIFANRRRNRAE